MITIGGKEYPVKYTFATFKRIMQVAGFADFTELATAAQQQALEFFSIAVHEGTRQAGATWTLEEMDNEITSFDELSKASEPYFTAFQEFFKVSDTGKPQAEAQNP